LEHGFVAAASLVIVAIVGVPVTNKAFNGSFSKKLVGNQPLLAEKSAENHPREQTNGRFGVTPVSVFGYPYS
jgi:hypothetical protein